MSKKSTYTALILLLVIISILWGCKEGFDTPDYAYEANAYATFSFSKSSLFIDSTDFVVVTLSLPSSLFGDTLVLEAGNWGLFTDKKRSKKLIVNANEMQYILFANAAGDGIVSLKHDGFLFQKGLQLKTVGQSLYYNITTNSTFIADNHSYGQIKLSNEHGDFMGDEIIIECNNAMFLNGLSKDTAMVRPDGTCEFYIKAREFGKKELSISNTTSYSYSQYIEFTPAYPEYIRIELDTNLIQYPQTIHVKAMCTRSLGEVSEGIYINFSDSSDLPNGMSIGSFNNITRVNNEGIASSIYELTYTDTFTYVTIEASVTPLEQSATRVAGYKTIYHNSD
ncbi:hypothetical protein [Carboxylicivirga linearis]|uniref:DUF4382 domain-containing protein n=1 Tax=Carboxylicivirga linearis TaxID=1628157 RepID=A0ABS5JWI5_9BACT|nr:hypothetical protein [Carboxylicivirga linearis]MBS2099140.1 hypothetical protein [Carboxylicivirga linearis]